jgi:hypothetical protein
MLGRCWTGSLASNWQPRSLQSAFVCDSFVSHSVQPTVKFTPRAHLVDVLDVLLVLQGAGAGVINVEHNCNAWRKICTAPAASRQGSGRPRGERQCFVQVLPTKHALLALCRLHAAGRSQALLRPGAGLLSAGAFVAAGLREEGIANWVLGSGRRTGVVNARVHGAPAELDRPAAAHHRVWVRRAGLPDQLCGVAGLDQQRGALAGVDRLPAGCRYCTSEAACMRGAWYMRWWRFTGGCEQDCQRAGLHDACPTRPPPFSPAATRASCSDIVLHSFGRDTPHDTRAATLACSCLLWEATSCTRSPTRRAVGWC